jgi:hypothetical protein
MKYYMMFFVLLSVLGLSAKDIDSGLGTPVFKLKPEYRQTMQKSDSRIGIGSLDAKLQGLQVSELKPYFQVSPVKSAGSDITLIFRVSSPLPPQTVVNLLARDEHVQYAEVVYPDEVFAIPNDANYAASLYFAALEAEAAWDIHKGEDGTSDVIIAVVDTGTLWSHPDLAENIWNNLGEDFNGNGYTMYYNGSTWVMDAGDINGIDDDMNGKVDDLIGWDFMLNAAGDQANDPFDAGSHGTIVSGIACARTNNSIGVSSLCWNLTLMPISCAYGAGTIYRGYDGIIYAAENGADIINCSWGSTGYYQANQDAINYAYSLGSIIVAAAGNSNNSTPIYPSAYQHVLSTAALQNTGVKSSYSNYGGYVDFGATNTSVGSTTMTGGYTSVSSFTSYASPIAASLAGLVKSYYPLISQDDLVYRLKGTCDDVDAVNPGKENLLGEGKLNARRALADAAPAMDNEIRIGLIENRGATDANNNLAVEPGETFSVNLFLRSYGLGSLNGNFVLSTTSTAVNILDNSETGVIPADDYFSLNNAFSIYVLPSTTSRYITFTLTTSADMPVVTGATLTFSILVNGGGIFIWEGVLDGRDMSGNFIRTTLQSMGYLCTIGTTFPTSFFSFDAVFLSFGAVGSNIVRFDKSYMFTALREYLESGGRVYIEGVDVVGFDMATYLPDIDGTLDAHEVLWPLLGIASAEDGSTNGIDSLSGVPSTPTSGLTFTATNQTKVDYIDKFTVTPGNANVAFTESGYGNVGVVSAGGYNQRSFVSSYALRELVDGAFPNTRANLIARIMEFFEAAEVTLPVELTSFSAVYATQPMLMWSTASETQMSGFNIYHNSQNLLSTAVKANPVLIPATGGANGAGYTFRDEVYETADTLFYWLESVSQNGNSQFFGSISLTIPATGEEPIPPVPETSVITISPFPNPFDRQLSLELKVSRQSQADIRIYNLKGQLIKQYDTVALNPGTHYLSWDGLDTQGRNCSTGVYLLVIKSPASIQRKKLVKL